ncbi:MAG: glycosyltransferase [Prochlorococcaceae cyanobacterium]
MRLLIVSPRFPPSSAADSQRVRMLLPHFAAQGMAAEVLAVDPGCVAGPLDPWQAEGLPPVVPIHRVRGRSRGWSRVPGLGSVEARCLGALAAAGDCLLRERRFDRVLFSTTAFGSFRLGPRWRQRFGVPFVLDIQDPWVNDYYRDHPEITPPGGRLKYAVADRLNRHHEPRVLRACSGLVAVSGAYLEDLHRRYPDTADLPSLELPFPGAPDDFERLEAIPTGALPFDPDDGLIHWVSIGRGGADLGTALEGLFLALNRHAPPALLQRLRLHFLGTSYAAAGTGVPTIRPLAQRHGLAHLVEERTDRLPLSLTLATLKAASALLVIGSDDPAYTASKIVPYLLARRPLLAVMHERSPVVPLIGRCGGAALVTFGSGESHEPLADAIDRAWLQQDRHARLRPLDPLAIAPHTAAAQAAQLTAFLQGCR